MKTFIIWGLIAFIPTLYATDMDILLAKTSIALGDEYLKIADGYRNNMKTILKVDQLLSDEDYASDYMNAKEQYVSYRTLAENEYLMVFCQSDCPDNATPLALPSNYNFLAKEAFNKYEYTSRDLGLEGSVSKYAPIYAVNSNFEDQVVNRVSKIIEEQIQLDARARDINNAFNTLDSSYVDIDSQEITGVDQTLIKESNYEVDNQIQIENLQSCIDNGEVNLNFEEEEMGRMGKQYEMLVHNLDNHFEKVFDYSYTNPGGDDYFEIEAAQGWQDTNLTFAEGDVIYLSASGEWLVGSPVKIAAGALGMSAESIIKLIQTPLLGGLIKKVISKKFNPILLSTVFPLIINDHMKTSANGYIYSTSAGLSKGKSSGMSMGLSIPVGPVGVSLGGSSSKSSGSSEGISATSPLYLDESISSEAPVGALLGSFCDVDPTTDATCEVFYIGSQYFMNIDSSSASKKLWLVANNGLSMHQYDSGSLQVKVSAKEQFKTWWNQYLSWVERECDENGENCGLSPMMEEIAYTPNPFTTAKSMFVREFPDMPSEVRALILEEINYLVEIEVLIKNIKAKELSWELNTAKVGNCENQLDLSKQKLENTRDLIRTYSSLEQNIETKKILLETTRSYYESELEAINATRLKNLDRLRRYFDIAIKSFNYLYLSDYSPLGTIQQYREGEYYQENIERMKDQIFEITATNDLLNPNSGFVVYELSKKELTKLQDSDFRNREALIRLDLNEFFCKGFNLSSQARVSIEKMGVLLDINPANEYLFFKNNHARSTKLLVTHGSENQLYDFLGFQHEFWMPAQKRGINGISSRVLIDHNSDYYDLKNSSYFERTSFRKMSIASSYRLEMKDPAVRMYLDSDALKENPLLEGVKLVFWYKSAEIDGTPINSCLIPPYQVTGSVDVSNKPKVDWKTSISDQDYGSISSFFLYRSDEADKGYKAVSELSVDDCTVNGDDLECSFVDSDSTGSTGDKLYYRVRASHMDLLNPDNMMKGIESETVEVTLP